MKTRKQNGFTIVEVMISLAVCVALIGGIMAVFVGMKVTSNDSVGYGELQENGRFALTLITNDLMRQNFFGDYMGHLQYDVLVDPIDPGTLTGDCVGEGSNNASFPDDGGQFRTIWSKLVESSNEMTCITNAVIGNDILQLKRAVASPIPEPIVSANLNSNRYYIISNKDKAGIFPGNTAIADIPVISNVNTQVWEYQHYVYYISNDAQGIPVLMQGSLQRTGNVMNFQPMVDGIEHMHFMFGVDEDLDGAVDAYISAKDMTTGLWDLSSNNILAVKVFILARSLTTDPKYLNQNTYVLGDLVLVKNDNFRRLLFSTTTMLYNATTEVY